MSEAAGCSWRPRRLPRVTAERPRFVGRRVWRAARSFAARRICWRRPRPRFGCGARADPTVPEDLRRLVEPATMGDVVHRAQRHRRLLAAFRHPQQRARMQGHVQLKFLLDDRHQHIDADSECRLRGMNPRILAPAAISNSSRRHPSSLANPRHYWLFADTPQINRTVLSFPNASPGRSLRVCPETLLAAA